MSITTLDKGKGRARPEDLEEEETTAAAATHASAGSNAADSDAESNSSEGSSDSDSDSDASTSDSDSDSDSYSEEEAAQEFLESLLARARQNAAKSATKQAAGGNGEEEFIQLGDDDDDEKKEPPLPPLDASSLPSPYIILPDGPKAGPSQLRDPDVEHVQKAASSISAPAVPAPPPEVTADGKRLTKKEAKKLKNKTAGPGWFDLPAPAEADLPRLYREVEALRLHKQLDPKQFYRKEPGEGKGIKGLPKHFAIGTIVATPNPFGNPAPDNLPRSARKRTLVDELVDDAEAKSYAKKKFRELQTVRGARGRGTLAAKKAMRKPKW
ncbi:Fcf2-domain-containing protein [Trametes coccinea BRFM310]|uniref:Fcf2-domain-containing protein n=1 Tax=Trametes coccinea (strain BRFM310) TaxID=1353009 RepID=A0A1Y2J2B9_TRAC3|nr:Fcf2-domain-containing protein [Trametes coccinea BRFM310]